MIGFFIGVFVTVATMVLGYFVASIGDDDLYEEPLTRADTIRCYSNEEMAEFLTEILMSRCEKMRKSEYKKLFLNWLNEKI